MHCTGTKQTRLISTDNGFPPQIFANSAGQFAKYLPHVVITYTRFPVTSPQTGKLLTCWQQVVVMEFGKRNDATDTTDFCLRQLVTDVLRGNWCDVLCPLLSVTIPPHCRASSCYARKVTAAVASYLRDAHESAAAIVSDVKVEHFVLDT